MRGGEGGRGEGRRIRLTQQRYSVFSETEDTEEEEEEEEEELIESPAKGPQNMLHKHKYILRLQTVYPNIVMMRLKYNKRIKHEIYSLFSILFLSRPSFFS